MLRKRDRGIKVANICRKHGIWLPTYDVHCSTVTTVRGWIGAISAVVGFAEGGHRFQPARSHVREQIGCYEFTSELGHVKQLLAGLERGRNGVTGGAGGSARPCGEEKAHFRRGRAAKTREFMAFMAFHGSNPLDRSVAIGSAVPSIFGAAFSAQGKSVDFGG